MAKIPQRPECFDFALDFLGEPQAPELLAYVESLENLAQASESRDAELETIGSQISGLLDGLVAIDDRNEVTAFLRGLGLTEDEADLARLRLLPAPDPFRSKTKAHLIL